MVSAFTFIKTLRPPSSTAPQIIFAVSSQSLVFPSFSPAYWCLPSSIPWKETKKITGIYPCSLKVQIWTKAHSLFQRTVFTSSPPSYCLLLSCRMRVCHRYTHLWCLVTETLKTFMGSIFQSKSSCKAWRDRGLLVCAGLCVGEWRGIWNTKGTVVEKAKDQVRTSSGKWKKPWKQKLLG